MISSILENAFPGVERPDPNVVLSTADAISTARAYVDEFFPDCEYALLFGSYCKGKQSAFSDLDLIVFLKQVPKGFRPDLTRKIYKGMRVEVFRFTDKQFRDEYKSEYAHSGCIWRDAVRDGILVKGDEYRLQGLRSMVRDLPPVKINPFQRSSPIIRLQISNELVKLSLKQDQFDRVYWSSILFHKLCMSILASEGGGAEAPPGHHAERLERHDPALFQELKAAYMEIATGGTCDNFIAVGVKCLDRLGGPIWEGEVTVLGRRPTFMMKLVGTLTRLGASLHRMRANFASPAGAK